MIPLQNDVRTLYRGMDCARPSFFALEAITQYCSRGNDWMENPRSIAAVILRVCVLSLDLDGERVNIDGHIALAVG
ncbi:MAG: hypothetical protein ACOVS5_15630 [Oligoflexus sp.]